MHEDITIPLVLDEAEHEAALRSGRFLGAFPDGRPPSSGGRISGGEQQGYTTSRPCERSAGRLSFRIRIHVLKI